MQRLGIRTWGGRLSSADPGGPGRALPAAFLERAHGPPAPGQHPPQAQPLLPCRGRGLGGAHRAGM